MNKLFTVVVLLMVQVLDLSLSHAQGPQLGVAQDKDAVNAGYANTRTTLKDCKAAQQAHTNLNSGVNLSEADFKKKYSKTRAEEEKAAEIWIPTWTIVDQCIRFLNNSTSTAPADACVEEKKDFEAKVKDLKETCRVYLPGSSLNTCQQQAKSCDDYKDREKLTVNLYTLKLEAEEDSFREMMTKCPDVASVKMKDWEEQAKSGRKRAADLQKDAIEEQNKLMGNMTSLQEQMQKIDEEVQKLTDQEKNMLESMRPEMDNIDSATKGALQDMSMKIKQQQDQILQINDKLRRSKIAYSEAILRQDTVCEAEGKRNFQIQYERFQNRPNAGGSINQVGNIGKRLKSLERELRTAACSDSRIIAAKRVAAETLSADQLALSEASAQVKELISSSAANLDAIFEMGKNQKNAALKRIEANSRTINSQKQALMMKKQQLLAQSAQKTMAEGQKMAIVQQQAQDEQIATANANKLLDMASENQITPNDKFNAKIGGLLGDFTSLDGLCETFYKNCPTSNLSLTIDWTPSADTKCNKSPSESRKAASAN